MTDANHDASEQHLTPPPATEPAPAPAPAPPPPMFPNLAAVDQRGRLAAMAERDRLAATGPTARDLELAESWLEWLREGWLDMGDLARLLSSVRFDVAYVLELESKVPRARRPHEFRG